MTLAHFRTDYRPAENNFVSVPTFYHPTAYSLADGFQSHCLARCSRPNPMTKYSFSHSASQHWGSTFPDY